MNDDSILANGLINETTDYCDRLVTRLHDISVKIQSANADILTGIYVDITPLLVLEEEARIIQKRINENIATIGFYSNKVEFESSDFDGIENHITRNAIFISSSLDTEIDNGDSFLMNSKISGVAVSFRNTGYETWNKTEVILRVALYNEPLFINMITDTLLPVDISASTGSIININVNDIILPNIKSVVSVKYSIVSLIDGYVYGIYEKNGLNIIN